MLSRAQSFRHALADRIANAASTTTPARVLVDEENQMEYDVQDLVTHSAAAMREDLPEDAAAEVTYMFEFSMFQCTVLHYIVYTYVYIMCA